MKVIATVVTYDPVRRKGIFKLATPPGGRIHFSTRHLPPDLNRAVVDASRELNQLLHHPKDDDGESFRALLVSIRALLVKHRFSMEVAFRADGKPTLVKDTIEHLGEAPPT